MLILSGKRPDLKSSCCGSVVIDFGTYMNHQYTCSKCGKLTAPLKVTPYKGEIRMTEEKQCGQATPEELKEHKRKCWWTGCNKTSRLEHMGWRWCFHHAWYAWWTDYDFSIKNFYYFLKHHKVIINHLITL